MLPTILLLSGVATAGDEELPAPELPVRTTREGFEDQAVFDSMMRHHRTARSGAYVMAGSLGLAVAAPVVFVVTCNDTGGSGTFDIPCPAGILAVGVTEVVAGLTFVTGDVLMFAGSMQATVQAQQLGHSGTTLPGWTGVALFGLGTTVLVVSGALQNVGVSSLGVVGPVVGVGCLLAGQTLGFVQFANDGAHALSVAFVPTPNGVALSGRF